METWQSRPLDSLYAVVLIDAIVVKVRDTQVANRPVYVAIGVNLDGERDVLGLWMGPTGGEGAKQWMTMLTELRNRGVRDVLITCCDGLKGLPDAVRTIWPDTTVQTCVVHLVRNSLRYASKKHWSTITRQMRAIYTAPTVPAAEEAFERFAEQWRDIYPAMIARLGTGLGRVRAVPRVPHRAPPHRVHDELDREPQRPVPAGRSATGGTSRPSRPPSRSSTWSPPGGGRTGRTSSAGPTAGRPSSTCSPFTTVRASPTITEPTTATATYTRDRTDPSQRIARRVETARAP